MGGQQAERLVEGVGGEGGARRAGLLAPHLLAIELEDRLGIVAQKRDFLFAEAVRKEQIALLVEIRSWSAESCMTSSHDEWVTRARYPSAA